MQPKRFDNLFAGDKTGVIITDFFILSVDIKLFLLRAWNTTQPEFDEEDILVRLIVEPMPNLVQLRHRDSHNLLRLLAVSVHRWPSVVISF